MKHHSAFTLIEEREIPELGSQAFHYRHNRTGAQLVSMVNHDENKVFGINFKTPPADSTGVAHILEHSVLCGSERFPLRKPFIEMARGSLQTFLNAMTFPDKTAYPVASQNLRDFYNLVDVYLDAVLHPILSRETFLQEGWHFEAESIEAPFSYKGVVFNEMKGAYSAPEARLAEVISEALMPDTIYAHSSGGDPETIPDLSYEGLCAFHQRYYHPSNSYIFFYGDDDPAARLTLIDEALSKFDQAEPAAEIELQKRFSAPVRREGFYAAQPDQGPVRDGTLTLNYLLDEPEDFETALLLTIVGQVLVGTPASPLKRLLTESGLGERVIGSISTPGRQPVASFGMKNIDPGDAPAIEKLIVDELARLAADGLPEKAVEAAINTLEFQLRELNTGSFPRGIALMFGALGRWLHGNDPLEALAFAAPLARVKVRIANEPQLLADLVRTELVDNLHCAIVLMRADPELGARQAAEERTRLDQAREAMSDKARADVVATTKMLKKLQETPDDPDVVATLPRLGLADLPREGKQIPTETLHSGGVEVLFHELPTNGIVYLDLGFNLRTLEAKFLPFLPLFSRALTQTGTSEEDFASLIQRIGRTTGGVGAQQVISPVEDSPEAAAWLILRAKSTPEHGKDMLGILSDLIGKARLDDKERIRQMVREAKSSFETRLVPAGHQFAGLRLGAGLSEAGSINEQTSGISQLFFLRDLEKRIEEDWAEISATLLSMRAAIFGRANAIVNVTATLSEWQDFKPELEALLLALPAGHEPDKDWPSSALPASEGLTIPAQVNYVAHGFNLFAHGYGRTGATSVVLQHLNASYLWDRIRVQGGAYGGFASFNPASGNFQFGSYRDPNLLATLDIYRETGQFLQRKVDSGDLLRSIIGVIGSIDSYQLPDAEGFTALMRRLFSQSAEKLQKRREQVLDANQEDFKNLGLALDRAEGDARTVVLGPPERLEAANEERALFANITKVL